MQVENPYAAPKSAVTDSDLQAINRRIDSLEVSTRWKERFRAIAAAGGPSMKDFKTLPKEQCKRVSNFNVLAFLFGPFYYLTKGMWKKAILYTALMMVIIVLLSIILDLIGYPRIADSLHFGAAAIYAVRANIDFYKKLVLGDNGWW
ncbi:DUF2628 domain-containing protein [Pseudomonas sp. RL_15y_Pfl2_60]|uniref:DUF2628 domain-containing protein n=1 Tax=Pseudomonas sp. RL_15y_Pfl2_60 TaxID=3088709 RepID=UPI0030DADC3A